MRPQYHNRSKRENDSFYREKQGFAWTRSIPLFLDSISYERSNIQEWKRFRSLTGHWPVWSILFHYGMLASLLVGMVVFFFLIHRDDWEPSSIALIGIGMGVLYLAVSLGGAEIVSRLELHRYRRKRR